MEDGSTHCKKLKSLARKTLLSFHKDGGMVCPEYPWGVPNIRTDSLSRDRKAWELCPGDLICHRLFKYCEATVKDLFISKQVLEVPQYFSSDLFDKKSFWGRCPEGEVAIGSEICLPIPKYNTTTPGMNSKWERHDKVFTILARPELSLRNNESSNRWQMYF